MPTNPKETINKWLDQANDAPVYSGESLDDDFFKQLKAIEEPETKTVALATITSQGLDLGPVKVQQMGLVFSGELTEAQWKGLGQTIRAIDIATPWFYGDLVNHVKKMADYGDKGELVKWLSDITGYSTGTLENSGSIADRLDISLRNEKLTVYMAAQIFRAVEKYGHDFEHWMNYAFERNYSAKDMVAFVDGIDPNKPAMKNFNAKWRTFTGHASAIAKDMNEEERQKVASRLRNLAKRIESGNLD